MNQSLNNEAIDLSIVLPCLNEEAAIPGCLSEIQATLAGEFFKSGFRTEVIIVDNDSDDRSAEIIRNAQPDFSDLRLFQEKSRGYGYAYLKGLKEARGRYIFMADSDGTYDFKEIPAFIKKLEDGADLVVGNRFNAGLEKRSMSFSHRYIGNPFLSFLVRLFFRVKISDIHCGARAIRREALDKLNLCAGGMEFASEMIIKAAKKDLRISEIQIRYRPRIGVSKLASMRDGWRHLRFILLYSPLALFFLPGVFLFLIGIFFLFIFYFSNPVIFGFQFFTHPMFVFSLLTLLGYQLILFSGFSKIYAINHLGDSNAFIEKMFRLITLERAALAGIAMALAGILIYAFIFAGWVGSGFGSLLEVKKSIIALTFLVLGIQTFFAAFMFSILGIKDR